MARLTTATATSAGGIVFRFQESTPQLVVGRRKRERDALDSINYTFVQRGTRIHKTVHYFMMEPTGGGFECHDREFDEVRWISFDEAATLLSFVTERGLVSLAATRLPDRTA